MNRLSAPVSYLRLMLLAVWLTAACVGIAVAEEPAVDARHLESAVDQLGLDTVSHEISLSDPAVADGAPAEEVADRRPVLNRPSVRSVSPPSPPEPTLDPIEGPSFESPFGMPEETAADPVSESEAEGADESADAPEPSASTELRLTPAQEALRKKVRAALTYYYPHHLNSRDHNPWEMMHGVIAYGVNTLINQGGPKGKPVNAVAYLSVNGPCHGLTLLQIDNKNRLSARKGPYVQGHHGQLLAILAQAHVPVDYPVQLDGRKFTVKDLVETEKLTCQTETELTFKLISLAHYLHTDATWTDEEGGEWSIPKLINEEIRQPILHTAACGGTHRLMGLIYAVHKRMQHGKPIEGEFARAQQYTYDYQRYTFALQNSDGSFSTEWFKGKGSDPSIDRRIKTTGHILEWMAYSLPEDQLFDPRMVKAVNYLTTILLENKDHEWEVGPQGHALHALRIYDRRAFQGTAVSPPQKRQPPGNEIANRAKRPATQPKNRATPPPGTMLPSNAAPHRTGRPRGDRDFVPGRVPLHQDPAVRRP